MALTQVRQNTPGRTYYLRRRTDGESQGSDAPPKTAPLQRRLPTIDPGRDRTWPRPARTLAGGS